jgi:hypothetical protein
LLVVEVQEAVVMAVAVVAVATFLAQELLLLQHYQLQSETVVLQ